MRQGLLDVIMPTKKKEPRLFIYLFNDIMLLTQVRGKSKEAPSALNRPKKVKLKDTIRFKAGCFLLPSTGTGSPLRVASLSNPHTQNQTPLNYPRKRARRRTRLATLIVWQVGYGRWRRFSRSRPGIRWNKELYNSCLLPGQLSPGHNILSDVVL